MAVGRRGDKLPGTGELVFLAAIARAGRPLSASGVRRAVAALDQEEYTVGTLRSYCSCGLRLTARGWVVRQVVARRRDSVLYAITAEGRKVMGIVLRRIDGIRDQSLPDHRDPERGREIIARL